MGTGYRLQDIDYMYTLQAIGYRHYTIGYIP